jgi:hypothetical protein
LACGGGEPEVRVVDAEESLPTTTEQAPMRAAEVNRPPVVDQVSLDPEDPRPGEQVVARVSASDRDGDGVELQYRWKVGGQHVDASGPFLDVERVARGTPIELTVIATDGQAQSGPESATGAVANTPPRVLDLGLDPTGAPRADQDLRATPTGADEDGDTIGYRYRWTVNGAEIEGAAETLPAEHYQRGDDILLEVVANDGTEDGEPLPSDPIEVANTPPRITSTPGALGADGVFRYDVLADDPDGDRSFRFRLATSPEGMTIDSDEGRLIWQPGSGAEGSHPVEIEVSDRFGGKATQTFEVRLSYSAGDTPAAQDADEG